MSDSVESGPRLTEALNAHAGHYLSAGRLIEKGETPYQSYEVWDTPQFGRLFRLDGYFMTSEGDEFFYHENLIHVPCITQDAPARALIIGGGDGGSADELFKHPSMTRVALVELDEKVVDIARQHLPAVHNGALDDPRLDLHIADGLRYVRETAPAAGERFDLIVLDLTDPIGPAEALYTEAFFTDCKRLLSHQGALSLHLGAPIFQPERVADLMDRLLAVFTIVRPHFHYIPLYGSLWGMACASDHIDPLALSADEIERRIAERQLRQLQYYNGDTHRAAFAQPNYLRQCLNPQR
ncbi:polyamine aminopropyltransferase [Denitromonas iodatirespirans]|uniref:Polyamine aminopropyltransferase n=1 Tax=Denitromonas iodatirespirans TaxID=2795389 RepID=A0A944D505_DENI1|nr:polyamine aminopropyltransferase [Denitromonas iodatirespirans]MBT0959960.1 polyamine aminopropyltransferase [Denitromonas iodatirespirans]